jgi:hypothetical protein
MRVAILGLAIAGLAAPSLGAVPKAEEVAIFKAAGFVKKGGEWRNCVVPLKDATYQPGKIEAYRDVNGDTRPEAVVVEPSICYGNTGVYFWLLSKQADGSWKRTFDQLGMPKFLATKGADGWPDIYIGGPGFCRPIWRWNGREYRLHRFESEGKACRR